MKIAFRRTGISDRRVKVSQVWTGALQWSYTSGIFTDQSQWRPNTGFFDAGNALRIKFGHSGL